jgi:hypothetical protein
MDIRGKETFSNQYLDMTTNIIDNNSPMDCQTRGQRDRFPAHHFDESISHLLYYLFHHLQLRPYQTCSTLIASVLLQ